MATSGYSHVAISIEPDEPDISTAVPSNLHSSQSRAQDNVLSGNIGSSTSAAGTGAVKNARRTVGGIQTETRYTGMDTLDEPVSETFLRDARAISAKVVQVLRPTSQNAVLRDWDLWGPLIFCLALAVILSMNASGDQSLSIFTGVFVIVWVGSVVVTVNAKLLGGKVSFFQSLCVLGYCVFPLDLAALVALFVRTIFVRAPVSLAAFAWAIYAAINFLAGTQLKDGRGGDRSVLAVYPLFLLYFVLAWMIMLS